MNNKFKKNLILIFLTVVANMSAMSFIMPLLPFYAGNNSATMYSFLFASYSAAQFISSIPVGCLSDKFGRKIMILIPLFGSIIGSILQMFSPSLIYLILARFVAGCFGTAIVSCMAYISDSVKKEEKSKYLSRTVGFATLSFSIGPFISSVLYNYGKWIPFLMCAIVYGIIFVIDLIYLDDSPKYDEDNQRSSMRLLSQEEQEEIMKIPNQTSEDKTNQYLTNISIYIICLLSLCDNVALMCNSSYLGKRIKDDYTNNQVIVAGLTSFNSFVLTIFQLFLFPLLCKFLFIPHFMLIGYIIQIIGCVLILSTPFSLMVSGAVIKGLGYGMTASSYSVMVSHLVSNENMGKYLGLINTFSSLSQIISPIIFGGLYTIDHKVPFFTATLINISCVFFIFIFYYTSRKNEVLNKMKEECYNVNKGVTC